MSKENCNTHGIDWENIDMESSFELDLNLIEPLKFSTLLLEIECNLMDINLVTIRQQFERDLQERIDEAKFVFMMNAKNLEKQAKKRRSKI